MNTRSIFLCALVLSLPLRAGLCSTNEQAAARLPEPSNAEELLESVVARLPSEPLVIDGEMVVRKQRGMVVKKLKFELLSNWGSNPSRATYIIKDAFGESLESLTVVRVAGKEGRIEYAKGSPLVVAVPPDLSENIQGSDLTWLDLTFSFLWWKGGKITDTEKIKGRDCYVVEIPAPGDIAGGDSSPDRAPYSRVVLWIDKEIHVLMQAEGYSSDDELIRKLWVRSFKKIDGRWMVKDLEVQQYPSVHRTKLTIRDVKERK